jgi:hypothetical protein
MRSIVTAAIVLVLAIPSFADSLALSQNEITIDRLLTVTVVVDDPPGDIDSWRLPLEEGLALVQRKEQQGMASVRNPSGGMTVRRRLTMTFTIRPLRTGTFRIGPLEIARGSGIPTRLPAQSVRVIGSVAGRNTGPTGTGATAQNADPAGVVLRAVAPGPTVYVGQQVMLGWFLESVDHLDGFDVLAEPAIRQVVMPLPGLGDFTPSDRMAPTVRSVRRYVFYPEEPGVVEIPPVTVRAYVDQRQADRLDLLRSSRPVVIRVLPLPAGVSPGAVGRFDLDCSSIRSVDGAWSFTAAVAGTGSLFTTLRPGFETPPDFAIEITPAGSVTTIRSNGPIDRTQKWIVRIPPVAQPRTVMLPDLTIRFFDPATGKTDTARCAGQSLELLRTMPATPSTTTMPKNRFISQRSTNGRHGLPLGTAGLLTAIGLLLVFVKR